MLKRRIRQFHQNDEASSGVEFGVMIGAGILFIVFAFHSLSSSMNTSLEKAGDKLTRAMNGKDQVVEGDSTSYTNSKHNRRPVR